MAKGGSSNAVRLAVAGGVIVTLVAVFLMLNGEDEPTPEPVAPETAAEIDAETDTRIEATTETQGDGRTVDEGAALLPSFDTVRVDADGTMVVAGRWTPGGTIDVLLDIDPVARVEVDGAGQFVAIVLITPSDQPRMLTLIGDPDGARIVSGETILIAPFTAPEPIEEDAPEVADVIATANNESGDAAIDIRESETEVAAIDDVELEASGDSAAAEMADAEPTEEQQNGDSAAGTEEVAALPVTEQDAVGSEESVADVVIEEASDDGAVETDVIASADLEARDDDQSGDTGGTPTADGEPAPESVAYATDADEASSTVEMESTAIVAGDDVVQEDEPQAEIVADAEAGSEEEASEQDSLETRDVPAQDVQIEEVTEAAPAEPEVDARQAPAVIVADEDGVRVMTDAIPATGVSVDAISYDLDGRVIVSGRGKPAHGVRVYLNNEPVAETQTGDRGRWEVRLDDVAPGVYTMRVDLLGADGAVAARIETPFKREEPQAVAAVMARDTDAPEFSGVAVRTVQPGNTLWAISQERYGRGILYVHIFDANRNQIRDPDLIYPGQLFLLPELTDDELTEEY